MGKSDTPLMELIEQLNEERIAFIKMTGNSNQIDMAIERAKKLLKQEEQALIKARSSSFTEGLDEQDIDLINQYNEDAERWFNQEYF